MSKFQYRCSYYMEWLKCPYSAFNKMVEDIILNETGEQPHREIKPDNALILGSAMHLIAETREIEQGVIYYKDNYNLITSEHEFYILKLNIMGKKLIEFLDELEKEYKPKKILNEISFSFGNIKGTSDLIFIDDVSLMFDFKFTNNIDNYNDSPQLHIYKWGLATQNIDINKMFYVFIPKGKTKFIYDNPEKSMQNLKTELETLEILIKEIKFNPIHVSNFVNWVDKLHITPTGEIKATPNKFCWWCDLYKTCETRISEQEQRKKEKALKKKSKAV